MLPISWKWSIAPILKSFIFFTIHCSQPHPRNAVHIGKWVVIPYFLSPQVWTLWYQLAESTWPIREVKSLFKQPFISLNIPSTKLLNITWTMEVRILEVKWILNFLEIKWTGYCRHVVNSDQECYSKGKIILLSIDFIESSAIVKNMNTWWTILKKLSKML